MIITTASIFTASWFTPLPENCIRIGISRGVPRNLGGGYGVYRTLAPGPWFKSETDPVQWLRRYWEETLAPLDPVETVEAILVKADGLTPVLCCWEAPPPNSDWCHRAVVSAWLADELGLEIPELGHDHLGCGWNHPKFFAGADRSLLDLG
jgi:hypothetical protein